MEVISFPINFYKEKNSSIHSWTEEHIPFLKDFFCQISCFDFQLFASSKLDEREIIIIIFWWTLRKGHFQMKLENDHVKKFHYVSHFQKAFGRRHGSIG